MTNYIYLLYGADDEIYTEAAYGVGTLVKRIDAADSRIIVFTDQPDKVKDWPVQCESIAGQLETLRGKTGFAHRIKLCVMIKLFELYPGNMIFLDSDTFVQGNMAKLAAQLSPGTAIMHCFECRNPEIGLSGFRTTLAGDRPYRFTADSQMYNSGVVGLHRDNRAVLNLALELCDALLIFGSRIHTVEQFSISEALRISGLKVLEARRVVNHYLAHRIYLRAKIHEMVRQTGRAPWAFERPVSYSYLKVKWLKKFGYYLDGSQRTFFSPSQPST